MSNINQIVFAKLVWRLFVHDCKDALFYYIMLSVKNWTQLFANPQLENSLLVDKEAFNLSVDIIFLQITIIKLT